MTGRLAADDAEIGIDKSGLIALANPEAEELFGYTQRELIDKPINLLVPKASRTSPGGRRARKVKGQPNVQLAKQPHWRAGERMDRSFR